MSAPSRSMAPWQRLSMNDSELEEWRADMERKRDYAYQRVAELFDCVKPRGAFYLFPDIRAAFEKRHDIR